MDAFFEWPDGRRVWPMGTYLPPPETRLVLRVKRRWMPACGRCGKRCRKVHCEEKTRRWNDLPWADHASLIECTPLRVVCERCDATPQEALPWADRFQRETRRLQQHLALEAASMPTVRVAAQFGLSWSTVRRAEESAIARWEATRPKVNLRQVGVDEKYLGRRHSRDEKFVTIVSNLATGEPLWIGYGRKEATLNKWLATLSKAKKKGIRKARQTARSCPRQRVARALRWPRGAHDGGPIPGLRGDEEHDMEVDLLRALDAVKPAIAGPRTEPPPSRVRRRVEMQGFNGLDDAQVAAIAPWLRLAPAACALWTAVATVLGSAVITAALVAFAAAGAIGRGHPFDVVYQRGLRHIPGAPAIPPYPAPRRFACALATTWLLAMAAALRAGHATLGRALGAGLVATASVIVLTGFCVPSWLYGKLFARRSRRASAA